MHAEAMEWVRAHAPLDALSVLDLGGRDVNGSPRGLFAQAAVYRVVDIAPGPDVDVVADAATWTPTRTFEAVLCCEVFEHAPEWPSIVRAARAALAPGGVFVATMAGPGREPHSAVDGGPVRPGEWYANVTPADLRAALEATFGRGYFVVDQAGPDVRCHATKAAG